MHEKKGNKLHTKKHISSLFVVVIERIVILQEKIKSKPLTVKNLLQSGDHRMDKVTCSIPCNRRTGEGLDDILLRALGTLCGDAPVEHGSLIKLAGSESLRHFWRAHQNEQRQREAFE
jgi:hypothetical protein